VGTENIYDINTCVMFFNAGSVE